MNGVAIYMEGGGNSRDTKAALRQGMDAFLTVLKEAARSKSWHWKLVCCGGRRETFDAFVRAVIADGMTVTVLLVDAEGPVKGSVHEHLHERDGWDYSTADDAAVHLMIETMETWIVADAPTLANYYGQRFNANPLPKAQNLEAVAKNTIATGLERATRATQKGPYHKIRHASDLLRLIDPQVVQQRCPACARLFSKLGAAIAKAGD